jgi:hypothetical protein
MNPFGIHDFHYCLFKDSTLLSIQRSYYASEILGLWAFTRKETRKKAHPVMNLIDNEYLQP